MIDKLNARYRVFRYGLHGSFVSSLYSFAPLAEQESAYLKIRLDGVYESSKSEIQNIIKEAAINARAQCFSELRDISDDIDDIVNHNVITELYDSLLEQSIRTIDNRFKQDVTDVIATHRNFRLRVNIREMSTGYNLEHILFSEREKTLEPLSLKQTDILGRRYNSEIFVERTLQNMEANIQRQIMLFGLISLGHENAQIAGGSYDGKIIKLEDFFLLSEKIFHFASRSRLKPLNIEEKSV